MKTSIIVGACAAAMGLASSAMAATLDDVKARGTLMCGVNVGMTGFAMPDANGRWEGFDVAICRAVAAAVLSDPEAVEFVGANAKTRFASLTSGEIDLLVRNTSWTFLHDVDYEFDFVGVNYYDGQAFMVPKNMGVTSVRDLNGATICIETGTTTELNLGDYFRTNSMEYTPVPVGEMAEAQRKYLAGQCDVYTADASALAAVRASYEVPGDHVILPEIISKEPLGPLVREGDDDWADIVRWTLNALIAAEELGVTSANIEEMSKGSNAPEINRLLGTEGEYGKMLGLDAEWAKRAIMVGGNYGEIFARHIGENTPVGLTRGLNAQWKDGGLIYAPPFR